MDTCIQFLLQVSFLTAPIVNHAFDDREGDEAGLLRPAAESSQPDDSNNDTQMVIITGMTSTFSPAWSLNFDSITHIRYLPKLLSHQGKAPSWKTWDSFS